MERTLLTWMSVGQKGPLLLESGNTSIAPLVWELEGLSHRLERARFSQEREVSMCRPLFSCSLPPWELQGKAGRGALPPLSPQ